LGRRFADRQNFRLEASFLSPSGDFAAFLGRFRPQTMIDAQHQGGFEFSRPRPSGQKVHQGDGIAAARHRHRARPDFAAAGQG
jgi:hypothetical protein